MPHPLAEFGTALAYALSVMQAFPALEPGVPGLGLSHFAETRETDGLRSHPGEDGEISDALLAVWAMLMQQQMIPLEEMVSGGKWTAQEMDGATPQLGANPVSEELPRNVDQLVGLLGGVATDWVSKRGSDPTTGMNPAATLIVAAESTTAPSIPIPVQADAAGSPVDESRPREHASEGKPAGLPFFQEAQPQRVSTQVSPVQKTPGSIERAPIAPIQAEAATAASENFTPSWNETRTAFPVPASTPTVDPAADGRPAALKAQGIVREGLSLGPVVEHGPKHSTSRNVTGRKVGGENHNISTPEDSMDASIAPETLFSTVVGLRKDWRQPIAPVKTGLESDTAPASPELSVDAKGQIDLPANGNSLPSEQTESVSGATQGDAPEIVDSDPVATATASKAESEVSLGEAVSLPVRQTTTDESAIQVSSSRQEAVSAPDPAQSALSPSPGRAQSMEQRSEVVSNAPLAMARRTAFEEHMATRSPGNQETRTIAIRIPLAESDGGRFRHLDLVFEQRRNDLTLKFHSPSRELQHEVETSMPSLLDRLKTESWLPNSGDLSPVAAQMEKSLEAPRRLETVMQSSQSQESLREPLAQPSGGQQGFSPDDAPNERREQQKRSGGKNRKREEAWSSEFVEQLGI